MLYPSLRIMEHLWVHKMNGFFPPWECFQFCTPRVFSIPFAHEVLFIKSMTGECGQMTCLYNSHDLGCILPFLVRHSRRSINTTCMADVVFQGSCHITCPWIQTEPLSWTKSTDWSGPVWLWKWRYRTGPGVSYDRDSFIFLSWNFTLIYFLHN